tara:strand:+ start:2204 stop:3661 length:1458 start_codon:yes stop_codon:yes gene_type:complete
MNIQLEIIKKASILIDKKRFNDARKILLDFKKKNSNIKIDLKFYYTLYLASNGLRETREAKKYLEKCIKIDNKNYVFLNNLANLFLKEGNYDKAEIFYLKSLSMKKNYLLAIVNLAILYQNLGKFDESKKYYLEAIELSPKRISLYFNLSRIDDNFIDEKKIKFLTELLFNEDQELSEKSFGYFLLANNERKKKNYKLELDYLKKANKFNFESMKSVNEKTLDYWKNTITKKFKNFKFINENESENKNLRKLKPVFIIGLPRSGSTITEVLLRANSEKISSLGEISVFNGVIAKGFDKRENNEIDLNYIGNIIYNTLINKKFNFKNQIFIDKSLENFFYIDVILKIFPKAIFVNTTRNIEDNIFAIYKQSLSKLSWTHTVKDILEYVDNYLKIINYFSKKYPNKIFSIDLENLTNNSKEFAKKLYDFCDLEWSDEALNFHNRKDLLISTASNIQVRDKIKEYDINKYKPYRILLKNFQTKYGWLS